VTDEASKTVSKHVVEAQLASEHRSS
jgi:hypothetical protein